MRFPYERQTTCSTLFFNLSPSRLVPIRTLALRANARLLLYVARGFAQKVGVSLRSVTALLDILGKWGRFWASPKNGTKRRFWYGGVFCPKSRPGLACLLWLILLALCEPIEGGKPVQAKGECVSVPQRGIVGLSVNHEILPTLSEKLSPC